MYENINLIYFNELMMIFLKNWLSLNVIGFHCGLSLISISLDLIVHLTYSFLY